MQRPLNRRHFLSAAAWTGLAGLGLSACQPRHAARPSPASPYPDAETLTGSTPAEDGFWFPPEWAPHERTLMAMPTMGNWRPLGYSRAEVYTQWAAVANAISEFEPVLMAVRPGLGKAASKYLSSSIELVDLPLNDGWVRDTGPMVLVNAKGERRVAGFVFNAWGEKTRDPDDRVFKSKVSRHLGFPMYPSDLVLEGGAVHLDGEGTVLTTTQCLLHTNRNPGWTRSQVEDELRAMLGAKRVIWLPRGLTPDPITDGHIDGIAAFAAPGVVLLHRCDDTDDPNHAICQQAKAHLLASRDAAGRRLQIVDLPLTGGHMNFYLGNGFVLVPTEGDPEYDEQPLAILAEVFAGRQVVGVPSGVLARGGGGVHCITQQVPRAAAAPPG